MHDAMIIMPIVIIAILLTAHPYNFTLVGSVVIRVPLEAVAFSLKSLPQILLNCVALYIGSKFVYYVQCSTIYFGYT